MSLKGAALGIVGGCGVFLAGCTTIYEAGKPVFRTSSNIAGLRFRSPAGSVLEAAEINNSDIHRAVGTEVAKGILSVGTAVATGGTLFLNQ
jgi:hypothetical protein